MRTVSMLLLAALVASGPAQAYQFDEATLELGNHKEVLDATLDSTGALDPYLGPAGACARERAVEAAKGVYDNGDERAGLAHSCLGGQCTSIKPPFDVQGNVYSCYDMVMEIVENILEDIIPAIDRPDRFDVASVA